MIRYWLRPVLLALLTLAAPFSAEAQVSIVCVRPDNAECSLNVGQSLGLDSIIVRVGGNAENTPVTVSFSPTLTGGANGTLTSTQRTQNGEAKAYWYGTLESGSVIVQVKAVVGTDTARRVVTLLPPKPGPSKYAVRAFTSSGWAVDPLQSLEYWYTERQLSHPATVEITTAAGGPVTAAECRKTLVLFRSTSNGAVTPDSVYGRMVGLKDGTSGTAKCLAPSFWTLGKVVGDHHVRAGLHEDPVGAVEFRARARALPRVIAGLALTDVSSFDASTPSDSTFHVERTTPTGKVAFDSVVHAKTTSHTDGGWTFTPVAGVDWPLTIGVENLRVSVAVSLKAPTKDWFFGASILQAFYGLKQEAVGMDVQGIVHISKRESTEFAGAGVMLSFDTNLLSILTTAFPLK